MERVHALSRSVGPLFAAGAVGINGGMIIHCDLVWCALWLPHVLPLGPLPPVGCDVVSLDLMEMRVARALCVWCCGRRGLRGGGTERKHQDLTRWLLLRLFCIFIL